MKSAKRRAPKCIAFFDYKYKQSRESMMHKDVWPKGIWLYTNRHVYSQDESILFQLTFGFVWSVFCGWQSLKGWKPLAQKACGYGDERNFVLKSFWKTGIDMKPI